MKDHSHASMFPSLCSPATSVLRHENLPSFRQLKPGGSVTPVDPVTPEALCKPNPRCQRMVLGTGGFALPHSRNWVLTCSRHVMKRLHELFRHHIPAVGTLRQHGGTQTDVRYTAAVSVSAGGCPHPDGSS